jgi:hypothetical protein
MGTNAASSAAMGSTSGVTVSSDQFTSSLQTNQVTVKKTGELGPVPVGSSSHQYTLSISTTGTAAFTQDAAAGQGLGQTLIIGVCYWIELNPQTVLPTSPPITLPNPTTCDPEAGSNPWRVHVVATRDEAQANTQLVTYSWSGNFMIQTINTLANQQQDYKIATFYKSTFQGAAQWKILNTPTGWLNSMLVQLN